MLKKIVPFLMTCSLFALTACGSSPTNTSNSGGGSAQQKTAEAPKSNENVTVTWWDYQRANTATEKALLEIINSYQKDHPNVKIERTYIPFDELKKKLLMGSAAGQLPDIVMIDNPDHQAFAAGGILADITQQVKEWGQEDKYFEGPMASTKYKGKNYGIPGRSNNLALFYNEDMLNAAGVKPPTNWDELKEAAKKLTKPGVHGFSATAVKNEQGTFQFLPFVWQAGSDLTNLNSQGTIDALNLWKDMVAQGYMSKEDLTNDQQAIMLQFVNGNSAMVVNGTWQIPLAQQQAKFKWGIVPLPSGKQGGTILGGENFAITEVSKHKDVAWDILKYSQQPDMLKKYLQISSSTPTRKDIVDDPFWQKDPLVKIFADSMKVAKARAYGPNYPKVSEAVQDMMQQVITGAKSPEDAVKEADAKIKPLLN